MCFKYEDKYDGCFDFMDFGDQSQNLTQFLLKGYNIKVNDFFYKELYKFFEKAHEGGWMEPDPDPSDIPHSSAICDKCNGCGWIRLN